MSERKSDSHAVDLSPQACGSFWAFLPLGPLWSTCKSASVQGTWWWWAATRMHRACGEEACGLKRVEMWLFLRERLFLPEHSWRPRSQVPCPPTGLPGPRRGPLRDCVAPELRPPECLSASDRSKALARPVGEIQGGDLVHGEAGQPLSRARPSFISQAGLSLGLMSTVEKKIPGVHNSITDRSVRFLNLGRTRWEW